MTSSLGLYVLWPSGALQEMSERVCLSCTQALLPLGHMQQQLVSRTGSAESKSSLRSSHRGVIDTQTVLGGQADRRNTCARWEMHRIWEEAMLRSMQPTLVPRREPSPESISSMITNG